MPAINVRDTKLFYEKTGDGDPPIVFVHGMCSGAWSFEDQMARLSPEFTCVAYDRRGHSRSESGSADQSDRTHVADLAALIDALGLDRPVVVGTSAGGVIALDFLRSHPNATRGAVLMEPPVLSLDPEASRSLVGELTPKLQDAVAAGGERAALDVFFHEICGNYWSQADDARREQTFANAHLLFPTLNRISADVRPDDLAKIDAPILLIGGTESPPIHRDLNRILATQLPNVRCVEIEGSAHVVYVEKPAEFAEAVRAFAREVAMARSAA